MRNAHLLLSKVRNLRKARLLAMIGGYYGEEVKQASTEMGIADDYLTLPYANVSVVRKLALKCFLRFGPPLEKGGNITRMCSDCAVDVAAIRVGRIHICLRCYLNRRKGHGAPPIHAVGAQHQTRHHRDATTGAPRPASVVTASRLKGLLLA